MLSQSEIRREVIRVKSPLTPTFSYLFREISPLLRTFNCKFVRKGIFFQLCVNVTRTSKRGKSSQPWREMVLTLGQRQSTVTGQ